MSKYEYYIGVKGQGQISESQPNGGLPEYRVIGPIASIISLVG